LVIGYQVNVLQTLIVIIINNLTDLIITINPNFTNCFFLKTHVILTIISQFVLTPWNSDCSRQYHTIFHWLYYIKL